MRIRTNVDEFPEFDASVAVVVDVAAAEVANVLVKLKRELGEADHVHVGEQDGRVGLVPEVDLVDPLYLMNVNQIAVYRGQRTLQVNVVGVFARYAYRVYRVAVGQDLLLL